MQCLPSTDEVRPAFCPCCGSASRRPGRSLGLWGHGRRVRHVEGPAEPEGAPVDLAVPCRRYLCRGCQAVVLVVPRGVLPWRHYTAAAIAWALALWGHCQRTEAEARRLTSTTPGGLGFAAPGRWASLRRWVAAALAGELFAAARLGRLGAAGTARAIAGRITVVLAAHSLPSDRRLPVEVQAWLAGGAMG